MFDLARADFDEAPSARGSGLHDAREHHVSVCSTGWGVGQESVVPLVDHVWGDVVQSVVAERGEDVAVQESAVQVQGPWFQRLAMTFAALDEPFTGVSAQGGALGRGCLGRLPAMLENGGVTHVQPSGRVALGQEGDGCHVPPPVHHVGRLITPGAQASDAAPRSPTPLLGRSYSPRWLHRHDLCCDLPTLSPSLSCHWRAISMVNLSLEQAASVTNAILCSGRIPKSSSDFA